MPFPLIAALAGGGLGMLKGHMQNQREKQIEDSDRNLAAATAQYSPWTGMKPQEIRHAGSAFGSMLGSGLQGGMMGAMMGGGGAAAPAAGAASAAPTGLAAGGGGPSIWEQMQMMGGQQQPSLYSQPQSRYGSIG